MPKQPGFLGVDLGGTNVRAALLDDQGEIILRFAKTHGADKTPRAVLRNTTEVIASVLDQEISQQYKINSLGIGVPGSVGANELIIKAPNLGWDNIDFKSWLTEKYAFPVSLANDITMAVWGEFCFGAAKGYQDVVFIALGTGVGGGFIFDGKLFTGRTESCVEVGHMLLEADGDLCGCGNRGCWESIVSGSSLKRAAIKGLTKYPASLIKTLAAGQPECIRAETIYQAYQQNDPLAQVIWQRFLHYLAAGINNIVVIFNPQILILGGGVTAALPDLVEELRPILKKAIRIFPFDANKITRSYLREDAGLIGAAYYGRRYGQN